MATLPGPKRQMEAGQIYIPLWVNGLHVNRSPLYTPLSNMGLTLIQRMDTLWGGSNMELTVQSTIARRPGFPAYDSVALPAGQIPDQFFSYQNLTGAITDIVDTQNYIYTFTPTTLVQLFAKSAGAGETSFQRVGNTLYMTDGVDFVATGYAGTIGVPTIVGIAVPTVAPTFTIGTNGFLLPTTGWTYGYSYGDSTSGQVSTMSPISADTGDLDLVQVVESSITAIVTTLSTNASGGAGPYTATFGTPGGNNFWVGSSVTVSGLVIPNGGTPNYAVDSTYVVTAVAAGSWSASTAQWGTGPYPRQNSNPALTGLTGVTSVMNPITIPGASAATPGVYTVVQAAIFSPTNAFDGLTATTSSASVRFIPTTGAGLTQIASGTPAQGQFVVNAATGTFTFAVADYGKAISLSYAVTPTTGGTPVSFIVTGPSSNNAFAGGTQTDTTGYSLADEVIVYRSEDGDGKAGPWYYLATIPNDILLTAATYAAGTMQTTYTFATSHPGGANNGFAGAPNTGGATIAGFANSGNNGEFSIVASTTTSITVTNPLGVTEVHAGTVNSITWTYIDTGAVYGYAFDYSVPDGELDTLIEAPINGENNPPPNITNPLTTSVTGTFSLITYYAGRLWGAVDNFVYFAGGPDVTFGSPTESFPPANVFVFPGKVTAMVPMPAGLVVFTSDTMFIIYGTSTATFYSQVYLRNRGVLSQNCVVVDEQTLYIYTTQRQCFSYSTQETEIGYNVAPLFTLYFPPTAVYLTFHRMGEDVGLFISDGSVNYMKYRADSGSWSPMCQIVGGADAFQSIETSNGVYTLMVGSAVGGGYISGRSLTSWTDVNGTYPCSAIVGSLIVSPPGATAKIDYITAQYIPTGTTPTFSILVDEVATLSGTGPFIPLLGVTDPPKLAPSVSIIQQRYYLKSANQPVPQELCHMMVKISYGAANTNDQLLTLGIS